MHDKADGTPELEANGLDLPWYKCWWKDEMAISDSWPLSASGLFHVLLSLQWRRGSLPADPDEIRKLVSVKPAQWNIGWVLVQPQFPVCDAGRRRNDRLDRELREALRKAEINRKSGSLGGQRTAEKMRAATPASVVTLHPDRDGKK